jgi:hypothetical protein
MIWKYSHCNGLNRWGCKHNLWSQHYRTLHIEISMSLVFFLIRKFSRREDCNDKSNAIYVQYNELGCGYSCKHFSAHDSHFIPASMSVRFRVKKWSSSPGRVPFGWFHISREPAYEFAAQRTALRSESLLIKMGICYHKSVALFLFLQGTAWYNEEGLPITSHVILSFVGAFESLRSFY